MPARVRPGQCEHEGVQVREFSVPPIVTIGDAANLTDPVWDNADAAPDAVQFVRPAADGRARVDVTCRQFRDEVVAVGPGPGRGRASQPGDRVGLMSRTRYEWTLLDYAIWAAGAVTVPIYETSSAEQAAWILADSGAVALRGGDQRARHPGRRGPGPAARAAPRLADRRSAGVDETWSAPARPVDPDEIERRRTAVRADDVATIIYTSGTTGRPKGCVLTHRNMYADIANAVPVLPNLFRAGRLDPALPPAGARLRPADPDRRGAGPGHHGALRRHQEPGRRAPGVPADLRALRAPGVREGLQRRRAEGPGRRQGRDLRPGGAGRHRLQRGAGDPAAVPGWRCAPSTRSSTGWSTASCGPRSAAGAGDAISGGAPLGARLGALLPGHRGDHLRGVRPDRDLARRRGQPAHRHPDRHRRPAAARRDHPDRRRRRDPDRR